TSAPASGIQHCADQPASRPAAKCTGYDAAQITAATATERASPKSATRPESPSKSTATTASSSAKAAATLSGLAGNGIRSCVRGARGRCRGQNLHQCNGLGRGEGVGGITQAWV